MNDAARTVKHGRASRSLIDDGIAIWNAGLQAVRGDEVTESSIQFDDAGSLVTIGDQCIDVRRFPKIRVFGGGKACGGMLRGLARAFRDRVKLTGLVHTVAADSNQVGGVDDIGGVHLLYAREMGSNQPNELIVQSTRRMRRLVGESDAETWTIFLISGGGSALLCDPAEGLTLADLLGIASDLTDQAADINDLNAIRSRLDRIKGGGLLADVRGGIATTLVISDILGDSLPVIASGPTIGPSPNSAEREREDARVQRLVRQFDADGRWPSTARKRLLEPEHRPIPDAATNGSALTRHECVMLANNPVAVDAAGIEAERRGYNHIMHCHRSTEGLAEAVGRRMAGMLLQMADSPSAHRHDALIEGGEPTVNLCNSQVRGRGGRNLQCVLAAYLEIVRRHAGDFPPLFLMSAGTDGEDGTSDAAGGYISREVHHRMRDADVDAETCLRTNNAHHWFERAAALLVTGPTGTNVCDVRVGLVGRS